MAEKKGAKYPYQWPDGSWHSTSWQLHQQNEAFKNPNSPNLAQIAAGAPVNVPLPPGENMGGIPVTPQPVDPAYEMARLGAGRNLALADSEAGYQRGETAWGTGYNADGSLNSSNPYSQAMLLQDNYKRSVTGTNNSMFAQGQGYSGARLNAQARNDRTYAEGSSALKDQARGAYHGINYGQLQTYGSNALGVSGEGYSALQRSVYGG